MSPVLFDLLLRSLWETVLMTAASGFISLVFGLPLGLALVATDRGELGCRSVVVASGACNVPHVPLLRQAVPILLSGV